MTTKRLSDLLGVPEDAAGLRIAGVSADSRTIKEGDLFVALTGVAFDGRAFVTKAIDAGAAAVLAEEGSGLEGLSVPLIEAPNARRTYAELSARYFAGQPEVVTAVTGTNGKTSIAEFTRQLWARLHIKSASLGTLGVRSAPVERPGGLTTPDPMALHEVMRELKDAGVTHACVEASSHGLDQHRLDGTKLTAAAFTNLTRDHLDYHGTELNYFFTKMRLFSELLAPDATAVINVDAPYGDKVDEICWGRGLKRITIGKGDDATLRIVSVEPRVGFQILKAQADGEDYEIRLPLIGTFQAENALMAAGLVMATGFSAAEVLPHIAHLKGVPGRMEFMGKTPAGGSVYVDYAHTPSGLETALTSARAHKPEKISVVFGCGGNRDAGKRPQMGEIAERLADKVFITDDNPRHEDPATIRSEILVAVPKAEEIPNRREAIKTAIERLGMDEILMINGKGHELGQTVGDIVLPHSDLAEVAKILSEMNREAGNGNTPDTV